MTITLTDSERLALEAEALRLRGRADHLLAIAREADQAEAWHDWIEADGEAHGYAAAIADLLGPTELDYDGWEALFAPVRNPHNPNAPFGGLMFETYGIEYDAVRTATPGRIWTLVTGDEGDMLLVSGWHLVNRLGYFVTEVPLDSDAYIEIALDAAEPEEGAR